MTSVSTQGFLPRCYCLPKKLLLAARVCLMVLAAGSACVARCPKAAHAQNLAPTASVASADFPVVTVSVLCPVQNDACICRQQDGVWGLEEDGEPQPITRITPRQMRPRTETTIFLDLYRNQDFVLGEMGKEIMQLIALSGESALFSVDRDYFSIVTPDSTGAAPFMVTEMVDDLGLLFNQVTQLSDPPYADLSETPLASLLLRTLAKMPPSDAETRRTLVVVSDGNDRQGGELLDDVIQAATAKQIPVHTVYAPTSSGNKANLNRLAVGTGGRYVPALDQVDWSILATPQRLCDLVYRSANAQARRVVVTQPGGDAAETRTVGVGDLLLDVPAPYVEVFVTMPGSLPASPVASGGQGQTPSELTIRWDLAPYPNRRLRSLGYEIPGAVPPVTAATEHLSDAMGVVTLTLPLENLAAGVYFIRAWVEDEFGLRGEADTILPLAPTPTSSPTLAPTPTPSPALTPTSSESMRAWTMTDFPYRILLLTSALTSLLLLGAAFWLWRKREREIAKTPSVSLRSPALQASAILYRLDSSVDTGVRQTIKLGDIPLNLPDEFYCDADWRRRRSAAMLPELEATIVTRDGKHELSLIAGDVRVIPSGKGEMLPLGPNSGQVLRDRDEIIFGKHDTFHYRYLEVARLEQQNGGQPDGGQLAQ